MNKSMLKETKNGDEVMDIITRYFLYISIPSAVLIITYRPMDSVTEKLIDVREE